MSGLRKNYITPRGLTRLRAEQQFLRLDLRPTIVEQVAYAASLGDRSENAEYIYGKRMLRKVDRRLRWLDKRIEAAEVVDPSIDRGERVYFGAFIDLEYPDGKERTVQLVGEDEIETGKGLISLRSPLGRVLLRKSEGDSVSFDHLEEKIELEIVAVRYEAQEPDPPSDDPPGGWRRYDTMGSTGTA